ncbi:MAG TPA: VWA domain-containing protein [Thermoanaerobaculia bacterium]|jgi:VWFA-related protein
MRFRIGAALTLCAATALAQEIPAPPVPTFSERVEVRVLDLDVDVTDSKGHPVADLRREDFSVKVGGKAVPIDYFTRVEEGAIHAPDLATASPDQILMAYKKGNEAFVPRNFLIFVDLGFLSPGLRNRSLDALRDLVTRLGPDDAARVVVFDRSPKLLADWTTSKETILSALSQIEKKGVGMSRLTSQRQTLSLIDSSPRRRGGSRAQLARQYAEETGAEIQTMLAIMKQELVTLTPLSGKKAFLYLSGGFEYQPGFVMSQYALGGPSLSLINIRDVSRDVTSLIRAANADEISFYSVDGSGLTGEGMSASNDDPLGSRPSVAFQARQDRQNGMQLLARDTGGVALLNTNDFDRGLTRIYQNMSTYYSVGVTLSKLPGAGYQDVRVEVNRPGVTVRARRGFEPRPETELVRDRARATMETDLSYNAIRATLQTAPATPEKKLYNIPVSVTLPASSLTFIPDGDNAKARAEFYFGSIDDKGRMSDITRQETTFQLPVEKAKDETPLRFDAQLRTKKGNYRIVVNVRDTASGRMGTARANVRVE